MTAPAPAKIAINYELPQGEKTMHYEGSLFAQCPDGTEEYPRSFDTAVYESLLMTFPADPMDAGAHAIRFM